MAPKEKKVILKLLELYKEMPCLWDRNHKDYRNKKCRNENQCVLLEIYKQIEPKATVKMMNKKIENLRTNYVKEVKKVKDLNRTVEGADIYVPTIYYFEALSFLGAYNEPYRIRDTLETEKISSLAEETQSMSSDISQQKKKRITQSCLVEKKPKLVSPDISLLNYKRKEEDWEVLGKSIGIHLRGLDKIQFRITQKIISDTIYYASIGALTHNSFISLGRQANQGSRYTSACSSSLHRHQDRLFLRSPHPSPSPQYTVTSSYSPQSTQLITHNAPSPCSQMPSSQLPSQLCYHQMHIRQPTPPAPLDINKTHLDTHEQIQKIKTEVLEELEIDLKFSTENLTNTPVTKINKNLVNIENNINLMVKKENK